jgi:hypothetical protein
MNCVKIAKWIRDGHYALSANGIEDTDDLLAAAGRALDKACSHDIVGECLFEGDDGKTYVGTVEFVINEANPEYVREVMDESKDEEG